MNEYDLMNLYFNFIFKDGNKSFRYVYASYEQLVEILYKYADEKFAKYKISICTSNSKK